MNICSSTKLTRRLMRPARSWLAPDECLLVYHWLRRKGIGAGVLVDVGACFGSALAAYADAGWTVHAFEPDPANCDRLRATWASAVGVTIDDRAVSDEDGRELPLYTSDVSAGISSLSPFHDSHVASATVRTVTLRRYLREAGVAEVTVLKSDAEGHDLPVLRGFDWEQLTPRVVICEFEDRKTTRNGYDTATLAKFLIDRGFTVLISEWYPVINYGRTHRWKRFQRYPATLDSDAWGNLIAWLDPAEAERFERFAALHAPLWALATKLRSWR